MSRIFCLTGKSASGKDTVFGRILAESDESLVPVVPYTTRPMRKGETDGKDYRFVTEEQLLELERRGEVIEKRGYMTTQGMWYYFTGKFTLEEGKDYILITTLEGAGEIVKYYGSERVCLVYLYVDDRTRLLRYIERESKQANPDYSEVCRRFLADQKDFSEENLSRFSDIRRIDTGADIEDCLKCWREIIKRP